MDDWLAWEPGAFANVTQARLSVKDVWIPDLYVYKGIDETDKAVTGSVFASVHLLSLPRAG